jgi:uncharacterized membrane protein
MLDLASLVSALNSVETNRTRLAAATAAVLGVTALDVVCAQQLSGHSAPAQSPKGHTHVLKTIVINRTPEEAYRFWHNFENLPSFMRHLQSVQVTGDRRSLWRATAPGGRTVEWEAEIVQDEPNPLIAWRSLEGSGVHNHGSVRFESATGGRGTILRVEFEYAATGGAVTSTIAKLFGEEPGQQVDSDLRAFKQVMETGEVVQSDASIHRGMHPAQPSVQGGQI